MMPIITTFIQQSIGNPNHSNQARKKEEKESKGRKGKENIKLSLFADDRMLYTKNPKNNTPKKKKKLLELINEVSNVAGYKVNKRNLWCFYTLIMNYQKEKFEKQSYLQLPKKDKLPRNKFNQGG